MSSLGWYAGALFLALLTALVLVAQWAWTHWQGRRRMRQAIHTRLAPTRENTAMSGARVDLGPVEKLLLLADIRWTTQQLVILLLTLTGLLTALAVARGVVVLLVSLFFTVTIVVVWWRSRFQKQRRVIHEELPGVMDAVLRNIDAGRSLEHALISAFDEASPVFGPLVFRLRNAVESGRDYTRLFEDFSALYKVPSLILIAIALRTTSRFGSSVRPVLEQVSASLRSRQDLRQEFMAATAETRFTAVTFAVLPPGLAAFMVIINDEYSEVLLNTATGHTLLATAGVLQVLGMLVIWRMIQGVGRG